MLAIIAASLILAAGTTVAEWTEPVCLAELNDHDNGYHAYHPCISSDGLSMIFVRQDSPSVNANLFEAYRNHPTGPFTTERKLTELNPDGVYIRGGWLSPDGLRYYHRIGIPEGGKWGGYNIIRLVKRDSLTDQWQVVRYLNEIHVPKTADDSPSLTSDELTIIWVSRRPTTSSPARVYVANRESVDEPFGDVHELAELNALSAGSPYSSRDGLRVYFCAPRPDNGLLNIYMMSRSSLDEPFDNLEHLEGVTGPDAIGGFPSLSPDEKTIYFQGVRGDAIDQKGIWVSCWIDDPFDIAVENLQAAIADKQSALALVNKTLEKETTALKAINELLNTGELDNRTAVQSKLTIYRAITSQLKARSELNKAIQQLELSLQILQASNNHIPPAASGHPQHEKDPPRNLLNRFRGAGR
jgi:hypothetical protein